MGGTCVFLGACVLPCCDNTAGFFLFARDFSGYLLNFAEVTRKSNGSWTAVAGILPLYITYTFAERPKVENWHFSKCGDIQRRICYAFVIAWLHCFHIWVCQYLYFETASCHAFFLGWRLTCQDSRDLYHFNT